MNEIITQAFNRHYFDLGIYRFAARHRKRLRFVYPALWGLAVIFSVIGMVKVGAAFGALFMLWIFATAIDHIIIGFSISRVMKSLERSGVRTSWSKVVEVVGLK